MRHRDELDLNRLARGSLHFRRRVIVLAPHSELRVDDEPWPDTIVFLEAGEVELECVAGERRGFAPGAVLCFARVRVLRNSGSDSARLIAISRRTSSG